MKRWHIGGAVVAMAAAHLSSPAIASGGPWAAPTYLHTTGGTPAEQQRLFAGRMGVVLTDAPQSMLFLHWRLLHGLEVGPAGADLVARYRWVPEGPDEGNSGWFAARALVTNAPPMGTASVDEEGDCSANCVNVATSVPYIQLDKAQPGEYDYRPTCFNDALNLATRTLKDRVQRYGAKDPWVAVWLQGQDQVFYQCGESKEHPLAPLAADAPEWLKQDRAYQEAAWSLYAGRFRESADRFAAIARDGRSPWQGMGVYLTARALYREAIEDPQPDSYKRARIAIDMLAAAPPGTYAQAEAVGMRRAIDFRERPRWLFNDLEKQLNAPRPAPDLALAFKDYQWLGWQLKNVPLPEIADWIATVQTGINYSEDPDPQPEALAHARARWAETKDVAWLIAALIVAHPGDAAAQALAVDAANVPADHPGWLTAQYHLMRLTITTVPSAETRARVDRILALPSLAQTERNLFLSVRAQVATGLPDFVAQVLRKPFCTATKPAYCAGDDIPEGDITMAKTPTGWVGFGEESRAIIDRMPLDTRIALSRSAALPRQLRLDIALTNFPRAVLLQDDAAVDQVARDLVTLLPQMAADWRGVIAAKPGEAKRFATWFAMAKIPGLRVDLEDYYRPQGTIRQFRGYWVEWMMVPKGAINAPRYPVISDYSADGRYLADRADDPTCRGKCGVAAFPLRMPDFLAAQQRRISAERSAFGFYKPNRTYYQGDEPSFPKGTLSLWEAMFEYAKAHPNDPRSPEALYWLNRITRWGANPNGLSKRAFTLLHHRYPGSSWAKRAPYYFN